METMLDPTEIRRFATALLRAFVSGSTVMRSAEEVVKMSIMVVKVKRKVAKYYSSWHS